MRLMRQFLVAEQLLADVVIQKIRWSRACCRAHAKIWDGGKKEGLSPKISGKFRGPGSPVSPVLPDMSLRKKEKEQVEDFKQSADQRAKALLASKANASAKPIYKACQFVFEKASDESQAKTELQDLSLKPFLKKQDAAVLADMALPWFATDKDHPVLEKWAAEDHRGVGVEVQDVAGLWAEGQVLCCPGAKARA